MTIQQLLNEAVSTLIGRKVTVHGASRTDAGVSALGQVGLIEIDSPIPTENFPRAISDRLPPEVAVIEAVEVDKKFDLINDVKSKLYRYTVFNGKHRPVLDVRHCWHIPEKLDTEKMNEAAKLLEGTKDFKSFASAKDNRESSVRTIFRCEVFSREDWVYIDTEGGGFLYNMARNIAGTLVDIGLGRWQPEKIQEILDAKDRTAAGMIAPAEGLCLNWIKY
jgi:tRNA pseudouridine38-40 synthase